MAGEDVCEACGERNPADSAFCLFCGVYLGWNERPDTGGTQQPSRAAPQEADHTQVLEPQPPSEPRSAPAYSAPVGVGQPLPPLSPAPGGPPMAPYAGHAPCPVCGRVNEPDRRFCSRCGQVLQVQGTEPMATPPARRTSWWSRLFDSEDRRARRAYRRSLPAWYRWRRWLIALAVLALVVVALVVVGKNPVTWAKARWYDLRGTTVTAPVDRVVPVPQNSVADGFGVDGLADPRIAQSWATGWPSTTARPDNCGEGNGTGGLRLVLTSPSRLRGLEVTTGLPDDAAAYARMFHARLVDISWPGGCAERELKDVTGLQRLSLDTGHEVRHLTLHVASAYPPPANVRATEQVAITEIRLLERPS